MSISKSLNLVNLVNSEISNTYLIDTTTSSFACSGFVILNSPSPPLNATAAVFLFSHSPP